MEAHGHKPNLTTLCCIALSCTLKHLLAHSPSPPTSLHPHPLRPPKSEALVQSLRRRARIRNQTHISIVGILIHPLHHCGQYRGAETLALMIRVHTHIDELEEEGAVAYEASHCDEGIGTVGFVRGGREGGEAEEDGVEGGGEGEEYGGGWRWGKASDGTECEVFGGRG